MATRKATKNWASNKTSKVSNQPCATEGCDRAAYYVESLLCTACYQSMWKWAKRSIADRVKRTRKLRVFQARLSDLG